MRLVRKAIGKTQPQFGRMIGVSGETIKSIEIGRIKISRELSLRVRFTTGIDLDKARIRPNGCLYERGELLSEETIRAHAKAMTEHARGRVQQLASRELFEAVTIDITAMLNASINTNKLPLVIASLYAWLALTLEQFGLKAATARFAAEIWSAHRGSKMTAQAWLDAHPQFKRRLKRSSARSSKAKA